ncbi:hypothetical protein SAMN02745245_00973 [Anaerosphaera aminiphila DSM 21120]|uniref:Uncharacterized protein n=1 Tax=Anaerosphaera aminiphila DSM 21120 TaxID=1120995 RepID=A0A1M5RNN6_9FIRM|nr:hypothetical protein [Anaerosphaera aminiphila]SHH27708.1 hypothetical protein SAMN02745245_00973 [Anaerosphaera aminiphila DSM 21120]
MFEKVSSEEFNEYFYTEPFELDENDFSKPKCIKVKHSPNTPELLLENLISNNIYIQYILAYFLKEYEFHNLNYAPNIQILNYRHLPEYFSYLFKNIRVYDDTILVKNLSEKSIFIYKRLLKQNKINKNIVKYILESEYINPVVNAPCEWYIFKSDEPAENDYINEIREDDFFNMLISNISKPFEYNTFDVLKNIETLNTDKTILALSKLYKVGAMKFKVQRETKDLLSYVHIFIGKK